MVFLRRLCYVLHLICVLLRHMWTFGACKQRFNVLSIFCLFNFFLYCTNSSLLPRQSDNIVLSTCITKADSKLAQLQSCHACVYPYLNRLLEIGIRAFLVQSFLKLEVGALQVLLGVSQPV